MTSKGSKDNKVARHLLNALQNRDLGRACILLKKYSACSNTIIREYGFAPIHYASGIEDVLLAEKLMYLMLDNGGDPNIATDEGETPLHIAASWGHANIVKILLKHGADLSLLNADDESPISCAIKENQFPVITIIKNHLFEKKVQRKQIEKNKLMLADPVSSLKQNNANEDKNYTPNKRHYNFDVASPFYINITHRKRKQKPLLSDALTIKTNIFELTEDNLYAYSKNLSETGGRLSFIERWRRKILPKNDCLNMKSEQVYSESPVTKFPSSDASFVTASEQLQVKTGQMVVLKTEDIEHTDAENSIRFYEKKTTRNIVDANCQKSENNSTISTRASIPLDYDTSVLREELTQIGDPPGPITSTTKQLYLRRLVKYKLLGHVVLPDVDQPTRPKFSIELERTLRLNPGWQESIGTHLKLEQQMIDQFQRSTQKFREGHLKVSFIYLLLDPRVTENLPGQTTISDELTIWTKFLSSIFYVGKGKCSRPYSHLYDAIRFYQHQFATGDISFIEGMPFKELGVQTRITAKPMSKKLQEIIDIWRNKKGVICVHVFHNIMPAEAYTREAAIIDALGLQNLTNQKRGDYYGIAQTWTMRDKKFLGISLLYKAMKIFLTEGESQLMPNDLV